MKYLMIGILFLIAFQSTYAQEAIKTLEEARIMAQEENKNILLVFSGSDWCKPCIQLNNEIIDHNSFKDFKDENLVLLKVDFPYKKKNRLSPEKREYNERLAEQFNPKGTFPFVLHMDSSLNKMKILQYTKGMQADEFIQQIN